LTIVALSFVNLNGAMARDLISGLLTIALFFTALTLVFREQIVRRYSVQIGRLSERRVAGLTIAVGAILGVLVSISSVGAGAISPTPCRSRWLPASAIGGWARSISIC
jgi:hypothetical protein